MVQRYYRSRAGWRDGNQELAALIERYVPWGSRVLEIGPGPLGSPTTALLGKIASELVGLDIDERVQENRLLHRAVVYDGGSFPLESERFDAVVADYVIEHLEAPEDICREVMRVLQPGGVFIFRTPNRYHYVAVLGRVLGDRWARRLRGGAQRGVEVYPRYYRMNSRRAIRRCLNRVGAELVELKMVEKEPSYAVGCRILFYPMMGYERLVNASELLAGLRANVLAVARKVIAGGEAPG